MLDDDSIEAVASEGSNHESLAQTEAIVRAGKHVWYDKPAGDDWAHWLRVAELARERNVYIQMGYMFRYHHAFAPRRGPGAQRRARPRLRHARPHVHQAHA